MVIGYPTYNRILLGEKVSRIFFMATENIQQKTLQEFSSLPTQKTMDTSYEKRGQTFCQHFFFVGTLGGRNTVVFYFAYVFYVASAQMFMQIKIVGRKNISSHEKNVDKNVFLPTITSRRQK